MAHFDVFQNLGETNKMKAANFTIFISCILFLTSCQSLIDKAARETKYSAYELVGVQKRDLFKKEVVRVKDTQQETSEDFKDALDRLKDVYAIDGGNLERKYRSLSSSYEDAKKSSDEVRSRVNRIQIIAQDLFVEWKNEINEIETPGLRQKSIASLDETQKRFREFHASLKKSEARMTPVLNKFRDQVLFLKHNLNAQAITGLKRESAKIEGDIESLIKEMNLSILQAEEFIKTM